MIVYHEKRCETCVRPIGKGLTDDCPLNIPSHLDVPDVRVVETVGCASYYPETPAPNNQAIHPDYRTRIVSEQVFQKIMKTLLRYEEVNLMVDLLNDAVSYTSSSREEYAQRVRENVMKEFGILDGESAKRFIEYMNDPHDITEEGAKSLEEARELAKRNCNHCIDENCECRQESILNPCKKFRLKPGE